MKEDGNPQMHQSGVASALTGTQTNIDSSILNGVLNGSATVGGQDTTCQHRRFTNAKV